MSIHVYPEIGDQWLFSAAEPVFIGQTVDGSDLLPPVSGDFNIELVLEASGTSYPTPSGYQGVALFSGPAVTMLHGDYVVTDTVGSDTIRAGDGNDTIDALARDINVLLGAGNVTVFGGIGDAIGNAVIFTAGSNPGVVTSTDGGSVYINSGADDTLTGGVGSATIVGATGDEITLNSAADTVNALAGNQNVNFGGGNATIYGAAGDTIGSSQGYVVFTAGGNPIVATQVNHVGSVINDGAGDTLTLTGRFLPKIIGAAGDSIVSSPVVAILTGQIITNLGGGSATINALAGNELVTAAGLVYGAAGDTIGFPGYVEVDPSGDTIGSGAGDTVTFVAGSNPIVVEASLYEGLSINSGAGDTLIMGAADNPLAGNTITGAFGDNIALSVDYGIVNASAGNEDITIGSGPTTVYGGVGDTVGTSVGTAVIFDGGSNPIIVADKNGAVPIYSGAGDTLTGGTAAAQFIGAVNNVITLGAGPDTVNAISGNETVMLGSGSSTIYGGASDTVGAGAGTGFIDLLSAASEFFFDQSGVYADTIVNFSQPNGDCIHLTTDTVTDALAHSQQVNGGVDTLITLSDNSTILLKGITSIDSSFFS